MKKIILILLTILLVLSLTACFNKANENVRQEEKPVLLQDVGKYPINWDGEKLYADFDAWLLDYEKIKNYPEKYKEFRGLLNTVDGLCNFIELDFKDEFIDTYDKLAAYAYYGITAFPSNSNYQKAVSKLDQFEQDYNNARAFFDEEMALMSVEERTSLFEDEKLKPYAHLLREYLSENTVLLSEKESLLQNKLDISHNRMETLYNLLAYADISGIEYELPSGEVALINDSSLYYYLSGDYDTKTKLEIYDAWWGHIAKFKNTFAYALETEMLEEYGDALVEGYENTLDRDLKDIDISNKVMDMLLNAAHNGANKHADYFKVYAESDNLDKYYSFTEYKSLSDYDAGIVQYDDGVDKVIEALGILGDEYIETFKEIINAGGIDVYTKDEKTGGAFEYGGFKGLKPFVMFNYDGTFGSVGTIAHEMGHACYDELSMKYNDFQDWTPDIFTQEVASTTNELLFYNYMINNATSDEEKLFYIENILQTWTGSFFRQCYFQEFENYCHEQVESGNILDPEDLANKWEELAKIYYGEDYSLGEYGKYRWITLDHLYYQHYVFQYATSICYASAIAQDIMNGKEGAVENYLKFLKAGNSTNPGELLKIAGIDIEDQKTYEDGLNYFYSLLAEFESLVEKK